MGKTAAIYWYTVRLIRLMCRRMGTEETEKQTPGKEFATLYIQDDPSIMRFHSAATGE